MPLAGNRTLGIFWPIRVFCMPWILSHAITVFPGGIYWQCDLWWTPAFPRWIWSFSNCCQSCRHNGLTLNKNPGQPGSSELLLLTRLYTHFHTSWLKELRISSVTWLGGDPWKLVPGFLQTLPYAHFPFEILLYSFPVINCIREHHNFWVLTGNQPLAWLAFSCR